MFILESIDGQNVVTLRLLELDDPVQLLVYNIEVSKKYIIDIKTHYVC